MPVLIEWNSRLSLGVEAIDSQHKKLIAIINDFDRACKHGDGKEEVASLLKSLADYAIVHFRDEEQLMIQSGYEEYERHKSEHEWFVAELLNIFERLNTTDILINSKTLIFLRDWFINHICYIDTRVAKHLTSYGLDKLSAFTHRPLKDGDRGDNLSGNPAKN